MCKREMRVEKRNMSNLIKREEKEGKEREGGKGKRRRERKEKEGGKRRRERERGRGKRERKKCKRRNVKELVPRLGNKANPCYSKVGDG